MIHSARHTVSPVGSIVFSVLFDKFENWGWTYLRTDNMCPTGRDCGLAEWINKSTFHFFPLAHRNNHCYFSKNRKEKAAKRKKLSLSVLDILFAKNVRSKRKGGKLVEVDDNKASILMKCHIIIFPYDPRCPDIFP